MNSQPMMAAGYMDIESYLTEEQKKEREENGKKEKEKRKLLNRFLVQELNPEVKVNLYTQFSLKGYHYIGGYTEFMNDSQGYIVKITEDGEFKDFVDLPRWIENDTLEILKKAVREHFEKQGLRLITSPLKTPDQWQKQELLEKIFYYHYENGTLSEIMEGIE